MNRLVAAAIQKHGLLRGGEKVMVALSGGADSVALLHVMLSLRGEYSLSVSAVHVNHMLRGDESDRDERFVRELCARLKVPLFVAKIDVAAEAARSNESTELCARRLRYAFFDEVCGGEYLLATAHTADDALETLIFNITRGTGVKGLASIPPKRGNVIRPLCLCTRANIEAYCAKNSLDYVTDSTNLSDDYTRNRIRHKVIPQLKGINPAVCESAVRLMDQCREIDRMLDDAARTHIAQNPLMKQDALQNLPQPVLARVIQIKLSEEKNIVTDTFHIEQICALVRRGGGKIQLPKGAFAAIENNRLAFIQNEGEKAKTELFVDILGKEISVNGKKISVTAQKSEKINNLFSQNTLDYDKIIGKIYLRYRQPGDKIKLHGRPTKSLKKLFCEAKIPLCEREQIPVIADESGVCWVCGFGISERVAPTDATRTALIIKEEAEQNA